jgi:hypothetical protein
MKKVALRPMKDLSLDERKQILLDYQVMKARDVMEKWNISSNVLQHIKFFHGKSSAVAGGYYHRDLLAGAVHPLVARIHDLKTAGLTSLDVASELNVPLETVNKNW